jgi:predicted DNA-binding transcriptional regulator AlpA
MVAIAKKSGIERATLYKKINDDEEKRTEFTAPEIVSLSSVLHLTRAERDKIFLSANVN